MTNLKSFQESCDTTIMESCKNTEYLSFGLISEVGEIAGVVKKYIRGDYDMDVLNERLIQESGDVLWYLMMILKYSIGEDITEKMQKAVDNRMDLIVTTKDVFFLVALASNISDNLVRFDKHQVYNTSSVVLQDQSINLIEKAIDVVCKITDPVKSMSYVTDKLKSRKVAGTLHGDGEGVRV